MKARDLKLKLSHSGEFCLPSLPFCLQAWLCFKFCPSREPGKLQSDILHPTEPVVPSPSRRDPLPSPTLPPIAPAPSG